MFAASNIIIYLFFLFHCVYWFLTMLRAVRLALCYAFFLCGSAEPSMVPHRFNNSHHTKQASPHLIPSVVLTPVPQAQLFIHSLLSGRHVPQGQHPRRRRGRLRSRARHGG